ncbi:MAG: acyl carrier protein [Acutalibacteraceae bacterium]
MLEKLKQIIVNYVSVNPDEITEDSLYIEDLGFNSYDFMSMLGDLETEFGVTVDETEIMDIHTVGESIAYIQKLQNS